MSDRKANAILAVLLAPGIIQFFVGLLWVADEIDGPWYLLWSPLLAWYAFVFLVFAVVVVGAYLDGGRLRRA